MPKSLGNQCNFNSGEWGPRAQGRFDQTKYANALKTLENWLIYQLGGILFRPGTIVVNEVKDNSKQTRLLKFSFSESENYAVEMGHEYFRFYANQGQVVDEAGDPVEIETVYDSADIFRIHRTQNADTMYLTHPDYPIQKLKRTSPTSFTIEEVNLIHGPFLDNNISKITIANSATTGIVTLTATCPAWATATVYVNGPDIADYVTRSGVTYKCVIAHVSTSNFTADLANGYWVAEDLTVFDLGHVGSIWRIKTGVVKIHNVTSPTTAVGQVQLEPDGVAGNLGTTTASTDWSEGAFSGYRGYPSTCVFHEQRLYFGGTTYQPENTFGSVLAQYENFKEDSTDDQMAITFKYVDDQVNKIRWIASCPGTMQNGTSGGTFSATSGSAGITLTAKNINASHDTIFSVAPIQPVKISSYLYYMQANGYNVRELFYNYVVNRQVSGDMTLFADHILRDGGGAVEMAYQQSPNDRVWLVRNDGQLAVMVRNAEQDVMGWSRIVAGSTADGPGKFESICIFSVDGADDEIWVIVKRVVNGVTKRFVEYFTPEMFGQQDEPCYLDCALELESTTPADHLTGLDHLIGEYVSVQVEGALPSIQQTFLVQSDGSITLPFEVTNCKVGLPYTGTVKFMKRTEGGGQGLMRRIYEAYIRLDRTMGLKVGTDINNLKQLLVPGQTPNLPLRTTPEMATGDFPIPLDSGWNYDTELIIVQDVPLPAMLIAVIFKSETEYRD